MEKSKRHKRKSVSLHKTGVRFQLSVLCLYVQGFPCVCVWVRGSMDGSVDVSLCVHRAMCFHCVGDTNRRIIQRHCQPRANADYIYTT